MSFKMDFMEEFAKRNDGKTLDQVCPPNVKSIKTLDEKVQMIETLLDNEAVRDKGVSSVEGISIGINKPKTFDAQTIAHDFDERELPKLKWLCHGFLLRGYLNLLVAAGGTGKSILAIIECVSVCFGKPLLGLGDVKQGNVLIINNEDDYGVLKSRIAAVCKHYALDTKALNDKLYYRSGYTERVVLAVKSMDGAVEKSVQVEQLITFIIDNNIKLVVVDPFISTHDFSENDNSLINQVASIYKHIAGETKVAIRLIHHTRKDDEKGASSAGNIDIARGASSLKDACRVAHTLSNVDKKFIDKYAIDEVDAHRVVRLDDAKNNFSLANAQPICFYKQTVYLDNDEPLGVLKPYQINLKQPSEEESAEKRKANTIHHIAGAAINKLGSDGGKISCPDLLGEYMNLTGFAKSQATLNFSLLPIGSAKKVLIKPNGIAYRIYQTKEDKKTATRYVHIEPD